MCLIFQFFCIIMLYRLNDLFTLLLTILGRWKGACIHLFLLISRILRRLIMTLRCPMSFTCFGSHSVIIRITHIIWALLCLFTHNAIPLNTHIIMNTWTERFMLICFVHFTYQPSGSRSSLVNTWTITFQMILCQLIIWFHMQ